MDGWVNRIHCLDATEWLKLPRNLAHLCLYSPPYNVGKNYEQGETLHDWQSLMWGLAMTAHQMLIPGGRIAVNVANVDRKPYRPLSAYLWNVLMHCGFEPRGEIIWSKAASVGTSTAWGSFRSPKAPVLRDLHEYVLVAQKPGDYPGGGQNDITSEEFVSSTKSIWEIRTVNAQRVGREAAMPLELARRLIKLYTYPGDVVLDPACGAGTTCLAAQELGRRYMGIDNDPTAVELAEDYLAGRRIRTDALQQPAQAAGGKG